MREVLNFVSFFCLTVIILDNDRIQAEHVKLSTILPKLQAIHEDAKSLLIKNVELKNKILSGILAQNESKIQQVKASKIQDISNPTTTIHATLPPTTTTNKSKLIQPPTTDSPAIGLSNNLNGQKTKLPFKVDQTTADKSSSTPSPSRQNDNGVDYVELGEFNKWVETHLDYAVKNTLASAETLKEEAMHNNGLVDYSEQPIKDAMEGLKYWQSALMFQEKTLKNENFEYND